MTALALSIGGLIVLLAGVYIWVEGRRRRNLDRSNARGRP